MRSLWQREKLRSAYQAGERFSLLSLAFAQEKVTKEKSARLAPVRRTEKDRALTVNRAQRFNFFCEAHLCPRPPACSDRVQIDIRFYESVYGGYCADMKSISTSGKRLCAEPSAVLNRCVVGIRRPIAGGLMPLPSAKGEVTFLLYKIGWGLRRFQGRPQSPWWSPRREGK